jgi:hypothetical protein
MRLPKKLVKGLHIEIKFEEFGIMVGECGKVNDEWGGIGVLRSEVGGGRGC